MALDIERATAVANADGPEQGPSADYEIGLESLSQWQLAWKKFKKHRLALIGLGILIALTLVALIGPIVMPYQFENTGNPDQIVYKGRPPSLLHPFGETGGLQRDVLTLVVNGAKWSLVIGFSSVAIGIVGTSSVDRRLLRRLGRQRPDARRRHRPSAAVPLPHPRRRAFFGARDIWRHRLFGLVPAGRPSARLVRSDFLRSGRRSSSRRRQGRGVLPPRIIVRHMLPDALARSSSSASLVVADDIIGESARRSWASASPRQASLGPHPLERAGHTSFGNWWWPFLPRLVMIAIVMAVDFLGDGLRDALDPRRGRVEN